MIVFLLVQFLSNHYTSFIQSATYSALLAGFYAANRICDHTRHPLIFFATNYNVQYLLRVYEFQRIGNVLRITENEDLLSARQPQETFLREL